MSLAPRFRIIYAWWPIREVRQDPDGGFEFTGRYYWRRRVYAVNNAYEGWIAFEDQQTEEHLSRCPSCERPFAVGGPIRQQLSDEEIKKRVPVFADFVSFRAGVRSIERDLGIRK